MEAKQHKRLLIISNNVLSETKNNGKTILSYIDSFPGSQVRQLYFSEEQPEISCYRYFKLSDKDILRGRLSKKSRGKEVLVQDYSLNISDSTANIHGDAIRLIRECIWVNSWKSKHLIAWLDEFSPTVIFFVGGDSCFAYRICLFIQKRYNTRLALFITDDYLLTRKRGSLIQTIRRYFIRQAFLCCMQKVDVLITVSENMRDIYKQTFGYDSLIAVNMTDSLKNDSLYYKDDSIRLIYTGSLYYGRDEVLGRISDAIEKINAVDNLNVELNIYTNIDIDIRTKEICIRGNSTKYGGKLNSEQLKIQLNKSDILVFIESFDEQQKEKVRFSLSTKIPEYLSLRKPIFTVGPVDVGSISYLSDVSMLVSSQDTIYEKLRELLYNENLQRELSEKAEEKFYKNHDRTFQQPVLLRNILGD